MASIYEHNKHLILRTASEEFANEGFAAIETSDIVARADLPKPGIYYHLQSKENLCRCVLESIVELLLQALAPFHVEDDPLLALSAYIRSKIHTSRELPHASKVFASEIIRDVSHLSKEYLDEPNTQAQRNVIYPQTWIDRGQLAPVDPHRLFFAIWATTQTYTDFDWWISTVTGKEQLSDANYDAAVETIIRLVLKGCTPDG